MKSPEISLHQSRLICGLETGTETRLTRLAKTFGQHLCQQNIQRAESWAVSIIWNSLEMMIIIISIHRIARNQKKKKHKCKSGTLSESLSGV